MSKDGKMSLGKGNASGKGASNADASLAVGSGARSGGSRASKRRLKDKQRKKATAPQGGGGSDDEGGDWSDDHSDAGDDTSSKRHRAAVSGGSGASAAVRQDGPCPLSLRRPLTETDLSYLYPDRSRDVFDHLLYPVGSAEFYSDYSKVHSVHISRPEGKEHFKLLPTRKGLTKCFGEHALVLNKDIFVWKDGAELESDNEDDDEDDEKDEVIINSKQISNYISRDHTIELRTPQKYFDPLWQYVSLLESEFDSAVSVSLFMAPKAESSVFVNLDEEGALVDTFVVQLAGSSHWTFTTNDDSGTKATTPMEVLIDAGDTVYVRPGMVLSCKTLAAPEESLFLLMRTNRNSNLVDLTELITQQAMLKVRRDTREKFLPRGLFSFTGVAHSEEDDDPRRKSVHNAVRAQLAAVAQEAIQIIDAASDQMAKQFMVSRLPVPLFPSEEALSYAGGGNEIKIFPYTKLKMLRPGIARATVEDGQVVLYSCMENSRDPSETVISPMEFELDDGPAIEALINAYPEGIVVSDLPHVSEELDDKLDVARALFKEGFLLVDDEASKPAVDGSDKDDDDDPF